MHGLALGVGRLGVALQACVAHAFIAIEAPEFQAGAQFPLWRQAGEPQPLAILLALAAQPVETGETRTLALAQFGIAEAELEQQAGLWCQAVGAAEVEPAIPRRRVRWR